MTINFRVDPKIKQEAQRVAEDLGFNLSTILDAYLRQFIRTKEVHFRLGEERPTKALLHSIRAAEREFARGDVHAFKDPDAALDFVDTLGSKK